MWNTGKKLFCFWTDLDNIQCGSGSNWIGFDLIKTFICCTSVKLFEKSVTIKNCQFLYLWSDIHWFSDTGEFDRQFSSLRGKRGGAGSRGAGGRGHHKYPTLGGSSGARARAASAHSSYDRRSVHSAIHEDRAEDLVSPTTGKSLKVSLILLAT